MRIALLSDIHGNSVAFDAVLADIQAAGGVDAHWILGDLVALGPDPVGVLERIRTLPNVRVTRGNTDRYVTSGDRPDPTMADAAASPALLPALVEVANTFAWTQGMITAAGWLPWLRDLPLELRVTLPDGTRFLGVHASPGRDDGPGILPSTDLTTCEASLVCVGHTHRPATHQSGSVHAVNLGAVSLAVGPDTRSSYVILDATDTQWRLTHRRVAYDRAAVIDQLNEIGHPARGYIIRHLDESLRTPAADPAPPPASARDDRSDEGGNTTPRALDR